MQNNRIRGYLFSVGGWVAAAGLFMLIRYIGLASVPEFEGFDFSQIQYTYFFANVSVMCSSVD